MNTVLSLALSRLKYNKSRTLLTGAAVFLTSVLLTGLAASTAGIIDMEHKQAQAESNVHATFKALDREQIETLKNHVSVESVKTNEIFATVEYEKMNGFLTYASELKPGIYQGMGNLISGHMPETADEISGPAAFFERMDTAPELGGKITISFRAGGKGEIQTREFTICGIAEGRDVSALNVSDSRIVYGANVSEKLVEEYLAPDERSYIALVRVSGEDSLSYSEIKEKIEQTAADIGCSENNIDINSSYLYTMTEPDMEMIFIVSAIALLIAIFSGMVIYSIYYVSVITDIQEIGRLKAIGAGKKQIHRILLAEGMLISAAAVPVGMVAGYLIPYFALNRIIEKVTESNLLIMQTEKPEFLSPLLIAAAAAVFLTVYISLLKPMRMAARISPAEAVRYHESGGRKRHSSKNMSVFRLCRANLIRNKKRTAVTMLTMGLSCVLFMSMAGVTNSLRAEDIARREIPQGDFRLTLDGEMNDTEYPENNLDSLQKQNYFSDEFIERITSIDGVTQVERAKKSLISSGYDCELFKDGTRRNISPMTREKAEKIKKETHRGELNYDKLLSENGAVFTADSFIEEYGINIGDTIPLIIYDGDIKRELTVTIAASYDGAAGETYFIIPEELYESLNLTTDPTSDIYIYADKDKYDSVKSALAELTAENEYFTLYSMDEELQLGSMSIDLIKSCIYVILIMIAVTGFMNLINTMITSISTRKRELGVLQAIGLSDRQLTRMLSGEGAVFTAGTLILSFTVGNIFGYLIFLWAKSKHVLSVYAYHYPVIETICLAAALTVGQLIITWLISKRVRRESLIDRIRSGE